MTSTPDTDERDALVRAALSLLREGGGRPLRVEGVLERAGLGTRAFYRHFASKDRLLVALFTDAAVIETARLRARMAGAADPLSAVVAWIDGRLDLAFDPDVRSDLQVLTLQARAYHATNPANLATAHATMLEPLVEQLTRGLATGLLPAGTYPVASALSIDAVTWGTIERRWTGVVLDAERERDHAVRFCLGGIGI